jgi:hypothetical protein
VFAVEVLAVADVEPLQAVRETHIAARASERYNSEQEATRKAVVIIANLDTDGPEVREP